MKNSAIALTILLMLGAAACKKSADGSSQVSLSASTTQATVGETVTVTLSSAANASRWSVSPSTATQAYSVTTSKTNSFTFNQAGVYTVSASTKQLYYNIARQSLDSLYSHTNVHSCTNGVDSASIKMSVSK